jgi:hypothetical protein
MDLPLLPGQAGQPQQGSILSEEIHFEPRENAVQHSVIRFPGHILYGNIFLTLFPLEDPMSILTAIGMGVSFPILQRRELHPSLVHNIPRD